MTSLDPRIDDVFKELERHKKAIEVLTNYIDAAIWRVEQGKNKTFPGTSLKRKIKDIWREKER